MSFSANFTAIDFETANRRRDSACQLAAVVVRDGKLVDERMWMIRPDPFFFSQFNIRIHGIHPADVEQEGTFADHWAEIAEFLADDCLIAHNAPFDIGVLMGCLERHQLPLPELHFSCTRLIAKQTWPDRPRYGLKPLSSWLGVEFKHHDALEDSRACAKLLLAAGIARSATSLEDLESQLRLVRGKAGTWGVRHASRKGYEKRSKSSQQPARRGAAKRTLRSGAMRPLRMTANPFDEDWFTGESNPGYAAATPVGTGNVTSSAPIDFQRVVVRAEFIQPLRGKRVFFVGQLAMLTVEQASEITRRGGGVHQSQVDASTNCVVVGSSGTDPLAVEAAKQHDGVEVLSEEQFLRRIGA